MEKTVERLFFASRWLLAPIYLGLSVALIVGGISMVDRDPMAGIGILAGLLLFFVAAIWGLVAARMVSAKRIAEEYIWLKGVHPEFLARLPEWPYAI